MPNLIPLKILTIALTLVTASLLIPIPQWQGMLGKIMRRKTRLVVSAILAVSVCALCAGLYIFSDVTIASEAGAGVYPILHSVQTSPPTPKPTVEPTPSPVPDDVVCEYVLNTARHKFHYPDCPSVAEMAEHNKSFVNMPRIEITAMGYDPCGRCMQ